MFGLGKKILGKKERIEEKQEIFVIMVVSKKKIFKYILKEILLLFTLFFLCLVNENVYYYRKYMSWKII